MERRNKWNDQSNKNKRIQMARFLYTNLFGETGIYYGVWREKLYEDVEKKLIVSKI